MERKHVYYRGQVQGVGFRYTTVRVARNYRVGGYVRNMMDGKVELVVEGEVEETESFLEELEKAMGGYISDRRVQDEPFRGDFEGFDIRF